MKRFGVMLDMSRNAVMKPEEVKCFAKVLKGFGYNMLQLYMEDVYEVDGEPYFGYMRGRYTKTELKDIVEYCNGIGVEVIPCIQTLAHLNQIFRWQEYRSIHDIADILLVGDSRTYELIENMVKSLRSVFNSNYIHIGMDEAHLLGLGQYLQKNGVVNRFEILQEHLKKVVSIVEKYSFTPIMWSDMFFRLANNGEYYPKCPTVGDEIIDLTPKSIELAYWDYYHTDSSFYSNMIKAHKSFGNNLWFAGGAWTWTGFAPGNKRTLQTMQPAMYAVKQHGIENVLITLWGDNGKECSYYSVLPSLFAIKKFYEGETSMQQIAKSFYEMVGEDFEAMMALDCPNNIKDNTCCTGNISKQWLYSDPFLGVLDTTVAREAKNEYLQYTNLLLHYAESSKRYRYLFEFEAALCDLLSVKCDLGCRAREAYQSKNKAEMVKVCEEFSLAILKTEIFHEKFSALWHKENKPHGFDVQDLRIGGLLQRLKSCQKRLQKYINGEMEDIPELEEKLLQWTSGEKTETATFSYLNDWRENATINVI